MERQIGGIKSDIYFQQNDEVQFIEISGYSEKDFDEYLTRFHGKNHRSRYMFSAVEGRLFTELDFISEKEMCREAFYEEFLPRYDVRYFIGGSILKSRNQESFFGFHYPITIKPAREDYELMSNLMPHLRRAALIQFQLTSSTYREEMLNGASESLSTGIVLYDRKGHIVNCNAAAESLIESNELLSFKHNRLQVLHREKNKILQDARRCLINTVTPNDNLNTIPTGFSLTEKPKSVNLMVCPLPTSRRRQEFLGCMVLITEPNRSYNDEIEPLLRLLYKLTPAESRLAISLTNGQGLKEYAKTNQLRYETARSTLKQIFRKTNTRSQSQLVRLLLTTIPNTTPIDS